MWLKIKATPLIKKGVVQCPYLSQSQGWTVCLRDHNSISFGVNCRSLLADLKYFDLCSGALIPDIMHDLLEGVLQHETKLMLKRFIDDEHYFTCAQLNECVRCLDLGYMEKCDRPTQNNI